MSGTRITVILSVIGWTWLARQLRGKVLALREEEFITAARGVMMMSENSEPLPACSRTMWLCD